MRRACFGSQIRDFANKKNLEKLSHKASDAADKVFTGGFTTEFITENKTLGLE